MCSSGDDVLTRNETHLTGLGKTQNAFGIVFTNRYYLATAAISALVLWFVFNVLDGLILLSPVLTFFLPIPDDAAVGFLLSIVTAILAGLVISMNIFLIKAGSKIGKASLFSGSGLGMISSLCVSCSSVGFYLASTFGIAGVAASSFLSTYQIPLRLLAIGVLIIALITAQRKIGKACKIST